MNVKWKRFRIHQRPNENAECRTNCHHYIMLGNNTTNTGNVTSRLSITGNYFCDYFSLTAVHKDSMQRIRRLRLPRFFKKIT